MSLDDWNLKLSDRLLSTRKINGFIGAVTKGARGAGKSMYNLKVMALCYYRLHPENGEDWAWNKALENFIFRPDQLSKKVNENIENDHTSLVWCIDDAGVHFSSYVFFINIYQASLLNATFDTIRTVVTGLLVNAPDKHRLMKALRGYDDYEITIYKQKNYDRHAVGIKWFSLPSGKKRFRKDFEDHYSCYVPKEYYNKYMKMRKMYLKEINKEIETLRAKYEERRRKYMEKQNHSI